MNENISWMNSKNNIKKNFIVRKVKNIKQNFQNIHVNKNNEFHSKLGKTAKVSPINFHNIIIGYANANKTNLNVQNKNSKINKNCVLEKSKSNKKSKSNTKSKPKKAKEPSRNIKQNRTKCNKKNKNINFIHSISHIQNNIIKSKDCFENITQYNSNNQTKIKNIMKQLKK